MLWLLNRVAAAVLGAFLVGCGATIILAVIGAIACRPECTTIVGDVHGTHCEAYASSCGGFWGQVLITLTWACTTSLMLGTLPGIAALTLTPARKHPWTSLPLLVCASVAGFAIWLAVETVFHLNDGFTEVFVLFLVPSACGLFAAIQIERLPRRRSPSW